MALNTINLNLYYLIGNYNKQSEFPVNKQTKAEVNPKVMDNRKKKPMKQSNKEIEQEE